MFISRTQSISILTLPSKQHNPSLNLFILLENLENQVSWLPGSVMSFHALAGHISSDTIIIIPISAYIHMFHPSTIWHSFPAP
jgi:superfamily I DNA and RNA helicase